MSTSQHETAGDWGYPEPGGEVITEGHAGSDTSKARALDDARSGRDKDRRLKTLALLKDAGSRGLTWWEVDDLTNWGHGKVSGALSNLHKEGAVARLAETRGRSKVYVLWRLVGDRPVEARTRNREPCTDDDIALWQAEGYERGRADGATVKEEELVKAAAHGEHAGYDRGFQAGSIEGYATGAKAVREEVEEMVTAAHEEGFRSGEVDMAARIAHHARILRNAAKDLDPTMHVHSGNCYLTRPTCMAEALLKAASRAVPSQQQPTGR